MKNTTVRLNLETMEARATPAVLAPATVGAAPAATAAYAASGVHLTLVLDDPHFQSSKPVSGHVQVENPQGQTIHFQVLLYWSSTKSVTSSSRPLGVSDIVARDENGSHGFGLTSRQVQLPHTGYIIAVLESPYGNQTIWKAVGK